MKQDPDGENPVCMNKIGTWICERCGMDVRKMRLQWQNTHGKIRIKSIPCPAMSDEFKWLFVSNRGKIIAPEWARSACLHKGIVYVPAAISGEEFIVLTMALVDGIDVVIDDGHYYLPAQWVSETFPEIAVIVEGIEEKVRLHFKDNDRVN